MPDYKAAYFRLLNGIGAAIEELQRAQREAEEGLTSGESPVLTPVPEKPCGEQAACCCREQDREAPVWSAVPPRRSLR